MQFNVQILKNTMGDNDYNRAFDNIKDEFFTRAGVTIEGEMIQNITRSKIVDTGRLRGSITYQTDSGGSRMRGSRTRAGDQLEKAPADSVDVGTNVEYAIYQEYGTKKMRGRPYIRPALRRSRRTIIKDFVKLMAKGLRRA